MAIPSGWREEEDGGWVRHYREGIVGVVTSISSDDDHLHNNWTWYIDIKQKIEGTSDRYSLIGRIKTTGISGGSKKLTDSMNRCDHLMAQLEIQMSRTRD